MKSIQSVNSFVSLVTDEGILARILEGEKELYELLIRRHHQKLYRVVAGYANYHQDIVCIMHKTYVKGYEKLDQFELGSDFSNWMIQIGINIAETEAKSRESFNKTYQSPERFKKNLLDLHNIPKIDFEKRALQQEVSRMLKLAIQNLEPKYRVVYILSEIQNMTISGIACSLGTTVVNVKTRLQRARVMIKKELFGTSPTTNLFELGSSELNAHVEGIMFSIQCSFQGHKWNSIN